MNLLCKLLLATTALAIASGPVLGRTAYEKRNPGNLSPDISRSYSAFGGSNRYSFTDVLEQSIVTDDQTVVAAIVEPANRAPAESLSQLADADKDFVLAPRGRAGADGSVLSALALADDKVIDLPAENVAAANPGRVSGTTSGQQSGGGYLISIAAIPEPTDWMTLLCGFVVVAFMAHRRSGVAAD